MCCELGLRLAKPRCKDEQNEIGNLISDTFESILTSQKSCIPVTKWNELSALDIDLSLFRPVYAPKDFLEILTQVTFYDEKIISQM